MKRLSSGEREFTTIEAAKVLGVCIRTVRRHILRGELRGRMVGRYWRIPESALVEWKESEPNDALSDREKAG
jgi:excisionase family DNA binding protein